MLWGFSDVSSSEMDFICVLILTCCSLNHHIDHMLKYFYIRSNKLLIIPPRSRLAKKSTMMGVVLVDKQCGNIHAFRCFDNIAS